MLSITKSAENPDRKLIGNAKLEVVETNDLTVNPQTRKFQLIVDVRSGS